MTGGILALTKQQLILTPSLTPLQASKAATLAVIILVVSVLIYDSVIATQKRLVRFVGKNFAHIAMFLTVFFLVLAFESGIVL